VQHLGHHPAQFVAQYIIAVILVAGDPRHILGSRRKGAARQIAQGCATAIPVANNTGAR
jgi:hypothetical protein